MKKLTVLLTAWMFQLVITIALAQLPGGGLTGVRTLFSRFDTGAHDADAVPLVTAGLDTLMQKAAPGRTVIGYTAGNRPVELHYFPGSGNSRALVIGGMHGSELSSIEVAEEVIRRLSNGGQPYHHVVVIPSLFPDNAAAARSSREEIGGWKNLGRYTTGYHPDPNREMPPLGKAFDPYNPVDDLGRRIETENQLLLGLIQHYQPTRIINVHAIRSCDWSGVFADPRTDCKGYALGFASDSTLAMLMASYIYTQGGTSPGNYLQTDCPTSRYYKDPMPVAEGQLQSRNLDGALLPGDRGRGISLGSWATTAACDEEGQLRREAIRLITMEFPGYKRPSDYTDEEEREKSSRNLNAYAGAITEVFLSSQVGDE